MRQLPLRARHELGGALFVDRGGWEVPASYADLGTEVGAVRRTAGLIDHSCRVKVRVSGPQRLPYLDRLVTRDLAALAPEHCDYTLVLNPDGTVVGDLWAYALEDAFLLDLLPDEPQRLLDHIRRPLAGGEVAIEQLPTTAHLALHGPLAVPLARGVLGGSEPPGPGGFRTVAIGRRRSMIVAGSDCLHVPGVRFISWTDPLEGVWRALVASGATPIGRDAWTTLRIEAGRPESGVDMGEDTNALETGMASAFSYAKGSYEGQEAISRASDRRHLNRLLLNRLLVGLRVYGDAVPARGDPVLFEGGNVGHVTSAAYSPTLRSVIALGYVRPPADEVRTHVSIVSQSWQLRAAVVSLPFVPGP